MNTRPLRISASASSQKLGTFSFTSLGASPTSVTHLRATAAGSESKKSSQGRTSQEERPGGAERTFEQLLLRELDDKLKNADRHHCSVEEQLKLVRGVLQSFLAKHASYHALLVRILTFYEDTAGRLLREVEYLRRQLLKASEDKGMLESALQKAAERAKERQSKPSHQKTVSETTTQKPLSSWTSPAAPKEPEVHARASVISQEVTSQKAGDKTFTRPKSVPKLNLEVITRSAQEEKRGAIYIEDF